MNGSPYSALLCLMVSGLLDAFDGRIARTKKNRTEQEKRFGIQIDSLNDVVCFGVLAAFLGAAAAPRLCADRDLCRRPHPPRLSFHHAAARPQAGPQGHPLHDPSRHRRAVHDVLRRHAPLTPRTAALTQKLRMAFCHTELFLFLYRSAAYLPLGASCGTSRFSGTIRPLSTATMCSSRRTTMLE